MVDNTVRCPNCRLSNHFTARFCRQCGVPITATLVRDGIDRRRQLFEIIARMESNIESRSKTDQRLSYSLSMLALALIILVPILLLNTEEPYGWGWLPIPVYGLVYLAGFLGSLVVLDRSIVRRNSHFARQNRLLLDLIRYLRIRDGLSEINIRDRIVALEKAARRAIQGKRKRTSVLRLFLPALTYAAVIYLFSSAFLPPLLNTLAASHPPLRPLFVSVSFICILMQIFLVSLALQSLTADYDRHEKSEERLLGLINGALLELGLLKSPLAQERQIASPSRNPWWQWLFAIFTLGLYSFRLFHIQITEPQKHFREQERWEDALLGAIRSPGKALVAPEQKVESPALFTPPEGPPETVLKVVSTPSIPSDEIAVGLPTQAVLAQLRSTPEQPAEGRAGMGPSIQPAPAADRKPPSMPMREAIIRAMIGMAYADGEATPEELTEIHRQIERAGLSPAHQGLFKPLPAVEAVKGVQDDENRRNILLHALLIAYLDGDCSPRQKAYRDELIQALDLRPSDVRQVEAETSSHLAQLRVARTKPSEVTAVPPSRAEPQWWKKTDFIRAPAAVPLESQVLSKEKVESRQPFAPPGGPPETVLEVPEKPSAAAGKVEPSTRMPTEGRRTAEDTETITVVMRQPTREKTEARPAESLKAAVKAVGGPSMIATEEAIVRAMIGVANANGQVTHDQTLEIRRQIERADLPPVHKEELNRKLREPIPAADAAKGIRDSDVKRTIFFYSLLTAHLDGDCDSQEEAYLDELIAALGLEEDDVQGVAADVEEYLRQRGREALLERAVAEKPVEEILIDTIDEAIVYVMIAMANADGQVTDGQWAEIHKQIELTDLPPAQCMEIERNLFKPIPAREVARCIENDEDKQAALFYALLIAYMDGEFCPEEQDCLDELIEGLGLGEEDVRWVEADIEEYFIQQESETWLEEEMKEIAVSPLPKERPPELEEIEEMAVSPLPKERPPELEEMEEMGAGPPPKERPPELEEMEEVAVSPAFEERPLRTKEEQMETEEVSERWAAPSIEEAIIRAMIGVAHADGRMSDEELAAIREQLEQTELPPTRRVEIESSLSRPIPPSEVAPGIKDDNAKRTILFYALLTAHLDGDPHPAQQAYSDELVEAMGLRSGEIWLVEAEVKEYLAQRRSEVGMEGAIPRPPVERAPIEEEGVPAVASEIEGYLARAEGEGEAPAAPSEEDSTLSWREKRFLNIMQVQRQMRVLALAGVLKMSSEELKEYVHEIASAGLFTGYADWDGGLIYAKGSEEMAEECPKCKAAREEDGGSMATCPSCGVELFGI